MIENAIGLVMRTRLLTETSLIVHWLTSRAGRVATVAKGARRLKSPFRGKLDLFFLLDFSFSRKTGSDLHQLREVSLRNTNARIREDIGHLRQACYCSSLIELATESETPLPNIFELMTGMLDTLTLHPPEPRTVLAFELKLLEELGLQPDLAEAKLSPGTRQIAKVMTENDWPLLTQLKLSRAQTEELGMFLHGFLIYHLGKIPRGRI